MNSSLISIFARLLQAIVYACTAPFMDMLRGMLMNKHHGLVVASANSTRWCLAFDL